MMSPQEPTIRRALISVFKKDGVVELARTLRDAGVEILSTGGTAAMLRDSQVEVRDVSEVTGFPEMMDGRVKTLHPRIHGGLLMRRDLDHHVQAAEENGIGPIDLVVVNLYPFTEVVAKPDVEEAEAIEMIDIGGPSMVRSAAKNHAFVTVLTDPNDYGEFSTAFQAAGGRTSIEQRRAWARKAFAATSAYDAAIAEWFAGSEDFLPNRLELSFTKKQELRYGENPHQRAAVYLDPEPHPASVAWSAQHSGKALSFNNYLDANAAYECVKSFSEVGCAVIKHKNPCGAAIHPAGQSEAFVAAHEGDPLSAYGGIVAFNRPVEEETARLVATKDKFFEVIVAPGYEGDSLEILKTGAKWGKNVRILESGPLDSPAVSSRELRWIQGGMLVQDPDDGGVVEFKSVTKVVPDDHQLADLRFAWAICRHVTSNAIVFAKNLRLVGVGAGQMSRVDSVEIAGKKGGERCQGAVMASDAFFPFPDGILTAHAAGIGAVVQPGGSIRDARVIEACDEAGISMVLTGRRHFRH